VLIRNGQPFYINRINIKGNTRTRDAVIRREMRIAEGDPFSREKIDYSQARIENLDFFKTVDLNINRLQEVSDKVDVDVLVAEKGTGALNFGMAFAVREGPMLNISATERNILGLGNEVSIETQYGSRTKAIAFGMVQPYFMQRNMTFGFDLSFSRARPYLSSDDKEIDYHRSKSDRTYNIDNHSAGFSIGYFINDYLSHSIGYSLGFDRLTHIDTSFSKLVQAQPRRTTTSKITNALTYNTLNNDRRPTSGHKVKVTQSIAGLGGNNRYLKHGLNVAKYWQISEGFVFGVMGKAGIVSGWGGKKVRLEDGYIMGMYDIGGFDVSGIGPRDKKTKDPLGAKRSYSMRTELSMPTGLPDSLNIRGVVFVEAGSAFGVDIPKKAAKTIDRSTFYNDKSLRASTGVGIIWDSPMGRIMLDYSRVLRKKSYDKTSNPRISFNSTGYEE